MKKLLLILLFPIVCLGQNKGLFTVQTPFSTAPIATNMQVWYDMKDNSTISQTTGTLTQLRDKSGNVNHSNPTGTQRGTVSTDGTTGKQVLQLNGTSNYLPMTTELSNTSFSIYIVVKTSSITTSRALLSSTSVTTSFLLSNSGSLGNTLLVHDASGYPLGIQDDESISDWTVVSIRCNGTSATIQFNGRTAVPYINGAFSAPQITGQLFANAGGSFFVGSFAEFIYYNVNNSDSDNLNIIKYLYAQNNVSAAAVKNIYFGDSITYGTGATTYSTCWAKVHSAATGRRCINLGISGTPFQNTGSASNNGYDRYPTQLPEMGYNDYIYILYGVNDINGVATGGNVTIFQTQYDAMVKALIAAGYSASHITLISPLYQLSDALGSLHVSYETAVRTVAQNNGCNYTPLYSYFKVSPANAGMFDTLHPNTGSGHPAISAYVKMTSI